MKPKSSLPRSHQPATCPNLCQIDRVHALPTDFLNISSNVILHRQQILCGWSKNEKDGAWRSCGGEGYTGFWWGNLKDRHHLEDPGVDGRIILRWVFRVGCGGMDWMIWLMIWNVEGTCECGNEPSGSIKRREFLDWEPVCFWRRTLLHGVNEWVSEWVSEWVGE